MDYIFKLLIFTTIIAIFTKISFIQEKILAYYIFLFTEYIALVFGLIDRANWKHKIGD